MSWANDIEAACLQARSRSFPSTQTIGTGTVRPNTPGLNRGEEFTVLPARCYCALCEPLFHAAVDLLHTQMQQPHRERFSQSVCLTFRRRVRPVPKRFSQPQRGCQAFLGRIVQVHSAYFPLCMVQGREAPSYLRPTFTSLSLGWVRAIAPKQHERVRRPRSSTLKAISVTDSGKVFSCDLEAASAYKAV